MPIVPRLIRIATSLAFALALTFGPVRQVAACTCVMGETQDVIRAAQLAFIGTVADQRDTNLQGIIGDELRAYRFSVERANVPTDAAITILAGASGPSCGMVFANQEEWLIIARREAAGLTTNLCSGNLLVSEIDAAEREAIVALLPAEPAVPSEAPEADPAPVEPTPAAAPATPNSLVQTVPIIPILVGVAALAALGAAGVWLRLRRPSRG